MVDYTWDIERNAMNSHCKNVETVQDLKWHPIGLQSSEQLLSNNISSLIELTELECILDIGCHLSGKSTRDIQPFLGGQNQVYLMFLSTKNMMTLTTIESWPSMLYITDGSLKFEKDSSKQVVKPVLKKQPEDR